MLFETKCNPEVGVSFGGTPTVYLHSPMSGAVSEFHIRSLLSGRLVRKLKNCTFNVCISEGEKKEGRRDAGREGGKEGGKEREKQRGREVGRE